MKIIKSILRWFFGVFFFFGLIAYISSPVTAIASLICAVLLLPPLEKKLTSFLLGKGVKQAEKTIFKVIVFVVAFILMIATSPKTTPSGTVENKPVEEVSTSPTPATNNAKLTEKPSSTPKPTTEPTKEALIEDKAKEVLGSMLDKVDIDKEADGTYSVYINYKARNDYHGVNTYYRTVAPVYKAMYTGNFNISLVAINDVGILTDKYGNKSTGTVYNTHLDVAEGSKINWNVEDIELQMIITDLATVGVNMLK